MFSLSSLGELCPSFQLFAGPVLHSSQGSSCLHSCCHSWQTIWYQVWH